MTSGEPIAAPAPPRVASPPAPMAHQAFVYGTDEEFLATAVPFVVDGLARGEPVLAATTSANLELLRDVLGEDAERIDHAESAYFGRRPAQWLTALHRYWELRPRADGHVRVLAEPVWPGRSRAEVRTWTCTESALNVALADTGLRLLCPYDTRHAAPPIVIDALRTHPAWVEGRKAYASADYENPARFVGARLPEPAPAPPHARGRACGDAQDARGFVAAQAATYGLIGNRAAALVVAAGDVAAFLFGEGPGPITVTTWAAAGSVWCDFHHPRASVADATFRGLAPAGPPADEGIWLARQLCDQVDIRAAGGTTSVRLRFPGPRSAEGPRPAVP